MFSGSVPIMRDAEFLEREGQGQRGLSAELDNHTIWLFAVDNVENIFQCERFEVQAVAGVVIGRHRFRIAIHHDRLDTFALERE